MYKEKLKKKTVNLQMKKNDESNRRKLIHSNCKKTFMRIQFIMEVYVYKQK